MKDFIRQHKKIACTRLSDNRNVANIIKDKQKQEGGDLRKRAAAGKISPLAFFSSPFTGRLRYEFHEGGNRLKNVHAEAF